MQRKWAFIMPPKEMPVPFSFMYVMNMIIAPSLASLNTPEDKVKVQRMITRTIRWVMLFSLPVFVAINCKSSAGKSCNLSGSEFLPGKIALIIICCGVLIDIAFGPVGYFALMTGNEKYNTIYMAISIFVCYCLNLILTPRMGLRQLLLLTRRLYLVFWNAAMFITISRKTGIRTWIFG